MDCTGQLRSAKRVILNMGRTAVSTGTTDAVCPMAVEWNGINMTRQNASMCDIYLFPFLTNGSRLVPSNQASSHPTNTNLTSIRAVVV